MATKIDIKHSNISGSIPTTSSLNLAEIAINTYDGKAYIKKDNGTQSIVELGSGGGGGGLSGGTTDYIPLWSSTTSLTSSAIYQSGSNSIIINSTANTTANPEALYVQQVHPTSFNVISGKGNLNNYLQLNIHNTNAGTSVSSDVVATANNGDENGYYIDMGINGSNFSGDVGGPNDAYLYATGSHLHIGNATPNKPIQFFVGGTNTDLYRKFELNYNNQHNMTGSLEISGGLAIRNLNTTAQSFVLTYNNTTGQVYYTASSTFGGGGGSTSPGGISGQIQYNNSSTFGGVDKLTFDGTNLTATGSFTGSFTGSLFGSASYATTASYILNAVSASYIVSASYAQSASIATSASYAVTASYVTGSIFTNSNSAASASYAITASYAMNGDGGGGTPGDGNGAVQFNGNGVFSGSNALTFNSGSNTLTLTGSLTVTGSNKLIGTTSLTGSVNISGSTAIVGTTNFSNSTTTITGSLLISGSTTQIGNNNLSGSTNLSGSITISGSSTIQGTTTMTGSLQITGSTTQTGNNTLIGNTTLSGSIIISGSNPPGSITASVQIYGDIRQSGYHRFDPVTTNLDTSVSSSYIYVSGSTQDLYFSQNGSGYNNVTRLRWLEGNLYTGLLNGALVGTASSTVFTVQSGSGIIVNLNASIANNPYPTIKFVQWGTLSASIAPLSASYDQTFVGIDNTGNITTQGTPFNDGQFDTLIPVGIVLHQNNSTINGVKTQPSLAYGWKQRSNVFTEAFGPLKLSGFTLAVSGSSVGSLVVGSGTSFADGANYQTDPNNPSYVTDNGTTVSKIFRYRQSGSDWVYDTNGGAGYTSIDPTQYSNNGVLTAVPGTGANRQYSIQRVFWYPNSVTKAIVVYYGNATYPTLTDATSNIPFESFSEAPNTRANAIYLGALIVRNNADFTVAASYAIQPGGLFRQVGGSGGGGSVVTTTLAGLSDVSITAPSNNQLLAYNTTLTKWQNVTAITASVLGNLTGTATTASYVNGNIFTNSNIATSASYSTTSSYVITSQTASYVINAQTASYINPLTQSVLITGSGTLLQVGSNILFVSSSGNVGIGTTTPPASILLDVAGAIRSLTQLSSATARINYIAGNTQNLQFSSGSAANQTTTTAATMFTASGNWVYQAAQNATDLGYRIAINGPSTSGSLYVSGSTVMTGSLTVSGSSIIVSTPLIYDNGTNLLLGGPTVGQSNGQVQISGSLGIGMAPGNFVIRPAVNGDTTSLKYMGTSFSIGSANSLAYGYSGGALGAITSDADGALLLDTGRYAGGVVGRVQVINAISNNTRLVVSSSNGYGFWASTEGTGSVGIGVPVTSTPLYALDVSGSVNFRNNLTVTGSITSTSFTGSLQGTSSWANNAITASYIVTAQTASYVLNAVSSSFASTASYIVTAQTASYVLQAVSSSFAATASYAQTLTLQSTLTDFYSVAPSTSPGINNIFTKNTGSFTSAFGKYTVYSGSNSRAGEFVTSWNGTTTTYYDNATTDIGSTSAVTFTSAIVTGQIQINTGASTPSGWQVKMLATFI
jgi:hypothetical protein